MPSAAPSQRLRPPSALARAALSLALLLGFYLVVLGIAAVLFVVPLAAAAAMLNLGRIDIRLLFLFAVCWIPGGLLTASVFTARAPKFVLPRRRLTREEAPGLFAMVAELEGRAGTAGPHEIYLEPVPTLAVAEVGSIRQSRRVMIVGAPLLHLLTVEELRAGIAHELGHFVGGDTRLTAFTVRTHALFAAVVRTTQRDQFRVGAHHHYVEGGLAAAQVLGELIVRAYGRLFLLLTRSVERRQELAADALSATLVGGETAARTLEKVSLAGPLYSKYLQDDVGYAVLRGAMPTDVWPGFERLRDRLLATDLGRRFVAEVRTAATDPFDTHPALPDRLRALAGHPPDATRADDARSAVVLMADAQALDAWLLDATRERVLAAAAASGRTVGLVKALSWASIPGEVYAPAALEAARRACERLHPLFPQAATIGAMFAQVWRGLESGRATEVALRLNPGLAEMPQQHGERLAVLQCGDLLATLLRGAALERGAIVEDSLGEPELILRLGDERVAAAEHLRLLATDPPAGRAALDRWAGRFETPVAVASVTTP